jgi:murein DD-endopeptidase MepM/ murein hydrolase activator NlpD
MSVLLLVVLLVPGCYPSPVSAPITEPFVTPACTYCAGHRVVEYTLRHGTTVSAVAAGQVTFSGVVAGTRYVTVHQRDGLIATYGILDSSRLRSGDEVLAGEPVGRSTARLSFGLRRDQEYLDPAPLLSVRASRARLVPFDGSTPRPGRLRLPSCAAVTDRDPPGDVGASSR